MVFISAPLPTIRNGHFWGEVANKRRGVQATPQDRTRLTLRFSQAVLTFCEKNASAAVALDAASQGADGLVCHSFLHVDPRDHHYETPAYATLLAAGF